MQKLNEKKILGTVPKKLQLVETFWDCPEFSRNKQNQNGITLIALIITIIVMLILVGVTINVALNGGLFTKAEEATTKTKIAQIQESLTIKKAEVLAENDGKAPADYGITIDKLNLPAELEKEYENKLIISKDGNLYYDESVVTDIAEQNLFNSMGIQPYVEEPVSGRVPFTNYIENGNNYYINGDKTSNSYEVAVFSKENTKMTVYNITNGQIASIKYDKSFEVIDKNEVKTRLGYTDENIYAGTGESIDNLNDDALVWNFSSDQMAACLFKSDYTQVIITTDWFTLDTTYTLPETE